MTPTDIAIGLVIVFALFIGYRVYKSKTKNYDSSGRGPRGGPRDDLERK